MQAPANETNGAQLSEWNLKAPSKIIPFCLPRKTSNIENNTRLQIQQAGCAGVATCVQSMPVCQRCMLPYQTNCGWCLHAGQKSADCSYVICGKGLYHVLRPSCFTCVPNECNTLCGCCAPLRSPSTLCYSKFLLPYPRHVP